MAVQHNASSVSKLQEHKGLVQFSKVCRNLWSLRLLKPRHKRVKSFNPFE